MNKSPLTSVLTGALALSALASLILCYYTIKEVHETRVLRLPVARVNFERNVVSGILTDAVEYSKTHPAMIQALHDAGITLQSTPSPAPKPAK